MKCEAIETLYFINPTSIIGLSVYLNSNYIGRIDGSSKVPCGCIALAISWKAQSLYIDVCEDHKAMPYEFGKQNLTIGDWID